MLILCVPDEMNRTEEISLLLQKIPDNTNPTGLKFKYFCVLQVIAGSIHNVDKEQSRRKRKMIGNSIGPCVVLLTKNSSSFHVRHHLICKKPHSEKHPTVKYHILNFVL